MSNQLLDPTVAIRDKAWAEVTTSPPYALFKALDDAVVAAGGVSLLVGSRSLREVPALSAPKRTVYLGAGAKALAGKRLSQADYAEEALRAAKVPLQMPQLLKATIEQGANIGGDKLVNLRSTVSKDDRFVSIQRGHNLYYWWLSGVPMPTGWNEAAGDGFLDLPAASSFQANREGGGGHDPATT